MDAYKKTKRLGLPGGPNEIIVDQMGQWSNPGQPTRIEGNEITMQGVPYPVWALPNVGAPTLMHPDQDYSFPGAEYVDELPLAQMNMNLDVPAPKASYRIPLPYNKEQADEIISEGVQKKAFEKYIYENSLKEPLDFGSGYKEPKAVSTYTSLNAPEKDKIDFATWEQQNLNTLPSKRDPEYNLMKDSQDASAAEKSAREAGFDEEKFNEYINSSEGRIAENVFMAKNTYVPGSDDKAIIPTGQWKRNEDLTEQDRANIEYARYSNALTNAFKNPSLDGVNAINDWINYGARNTLASVGAGASNLVDFVSVDGSIMDQAFGNYDPVFAQQYGVIPDVVTTASEIAMPIPFMNAGIKGGADMLNYTGKGIRNIPGKLLRKKKGVNPISANDLTTSVSTIPPKPLIKPAVNPKPIYSDDIPFLTYEPEINWSNWGLYAAENPQIIRQLQEIERAAKADGTWMENPDGTPFVGTSPTQKELDFANVKMTPSEAEKAQFVQSIWLKNQNIYPKGYKDVFRGVSTRKGKDSPDTLVKQGPGEYTAVFSGNKSLANTYGQETRHLRIPNDPKGGVYEAGDMDWGAINLDRIGDLKKEKDRLGKQIDWHNRKIKQRKDAGKDFAHFERSKARDEANLKKLENIPADEALKTQQQISKMKEYFEQQGGFYADDKLLVATDDIAEYVEKANLPHVTLKNIYDGGHGDVTILNHVPGNYAKSSLGNFEMNLSNPNVFKAAPLDPKDVLDNLYKQQNLGKYLSAAGKEHYAKNIQPDIQQDIKKMYDNWEEMFTPKMIERLSDPNFYGMTTADINKLKTMKPELQFVTEDKYGTSGSYFTNKKAIGDTYTHNNGKLVIDVTQFKLLSDRYGLSPKAIFEHEIRHALSSHMNKLKHEKAVISGNKNYNKDKAIYAKEKKAFDSSPEGIAYLKRYKDWVDSRPPFTSKAVEKTYVGREPLKPKSYPKDPQKSDYMPRKFNPLDPKDFLTKVDENLKSLTAREFGQPYVQELRKQGYTLEEAVELNYQAERNAKYFQEPNERYPHIVEMRRQMYEDGSINSVDGEISKQAIKAFITNSPESRIASFVDATDKSNIDKIYSNINGAAIIAGVLGLSGAGAALSEKQFGGSSSYDGYGKMNKDMFKSNPSGLKPSVAAWGNLNTERGNISLMGGFNSPHLSGFAMGHTPASAQDRKYFPGFITGNVQGKFDLGKFGEFSAGLSGTALPGMQGAPWNFQPGVALGYKKRFQEGGESDELPLYQVAGDTPGYIPPASESTAYSETTGRKPIIKPFNQDEIEVLEYIRSQKTPEAISSQINDMMLDIKKQRFKTEWIAENTIRNQSAQADFEEAINTRSFERPNIEGAAYGLISERSKKQQAQEKLEAEKKLQAEKDLARKELIDPYLRLRDDVSALQKKLKADGFNLGKYGRNKDGIDGKFGPKTEKSYNQVLKNKSLDLSIIDEYLNKYKSSGPQKEVVSIQKDLIKKGFLSSGEDDGKFGTNTAQAVMSYNNSFTSPVEDTQGTIMSLRLPKSNWKITSPTERSFNSKNYNPSGKVTDCAKGVCRMLELNNVEAQALGVKYIDAWGMFKNMEEAGNSQEIFNIYKDPESWRELNPVELSHKTSQEVDKNKSIVLNPANYKVGDVVGLFYPRSSHHGQTNYSIIDPGGYRDDKEAYKQLTNTRNTHVGLVSDVIDGIPYISHNISGTVHVDPLTSMGSKSTTRPVWVRRPTLNSSKNKMITYNPEPTAKRVFGDQKDMSKPSDSRLITTIVDNLEKKAEKQFTKTEKENLNKKVQRLMVGSIQIPKDIGLDFSNEEEQWLQAASLGILGIESRVGTNSIHGSTAKSAAKGLVHWWKNTPEGEKSKGIGKIKFSKAVDKFSRDYFNINSPRDLNDASKTIDVTIYNLAKRYESLKAYAEQFPELELQPEDIRNLAILGHNEGYGSQNQTRFGRSKSDEEYNPKTAKEEIHSMRMLYNMGTKVKDISSTDYRHIPENINWNGINSGQLKEVLYRLDQGDGAETYISKAKRYMYDVYGDLAPGIQGREYDPATKKFIDRTSEDTYDFTVSPDEQASSVFTNYKSYVKRDGGSIDKSLMLQYKNHIEGLVDNQRVYDKVNRIFYNDAKAKNMGIPNYVMTHVIR